MIKQLMKRAGIVTLSITQNNQTSTRSELMLTYSATQSRNDKDKGVAEKLFTKKSTHSPTCLKTTNDQQAQHTQL